MYFLSMKSLFSALTFSSLAALAVFAASGLGSAAHAASPVPVVTFKADPGGFKGDSMVVRVRVIIPKGWHIQSDAPLDEFLIPTEVRGMGEGLRFGKPVFPKPLLKDFPALGGKVALFEDTVDVRLPARALKSKTSKKTLGAALEKSAITLRYQACNDSQCLPPKEVKAVFVK
jgi:hypothetical protein